ncbi:hypothetical protein SAMN05444342_3466 [Haladaptatus paucihalophilus DX253]|nr:hypothetical protein SAMN05444342_3466 [Haladaptatus paucihalophilus DX253]
MTVESKNTMYHNHWVGVELHFDNGVDNDQ